jgi:hypothetical protein
MSWHNFIFSDKRSHRLSRHVSFWLLWWFYFSATYYYYLQVGLNKIAFGDLSAILILKTFFLAVVHLVACYAFIYFLLPQQFSKQKYLVLLSGTIALAGILLTVGYFIHISIFPYIDKIYNYEAPIASNTIWWTSINAVLLNAPKVIAAAVAIKLVKRWYLKQKEKERLEKEKLTTDLQLLKAQIRPAFLFGSLDNIYKYSLKKSPEAPELLIKFSDLLSYLLYECDESKVSLDKELNMMKEYMLMEKMRNGDKIEMEIDIKGEASKYSIAPLLLLPFIENGFKQCSSLSEQPWINIEMNIEDDLFTMKLMNGTIDSTDKLDTLSNDDINNVTKRLEFLYPGKHELKMYTEQEISMVLLKINLEEKFHFQSAPGIVTLNNYQFPKHVLQ